MPDDLPPILHLVDDGDESTEIEEASASGFDQIVDSLMGFSAGEIDDIERRHEFVELVARGYGTYYAGLTVGLSPAQIRQLEHDPEMLDIIDIVREFHNDTVEYSILRSAQAGNVQAQKMYALAKMPERGWVEKRSLVIEGQARVDVVHSVRQALQETLKEPGAIAGLHEAYIDTTAREDAGAS